MVNLEEGLKPSMSLRPRPGPEIRPVDIDQHVEEDVDRRRLLGEVPDAALGGVQTRLQHLEGEGVPVTRQQFAVEPEARFRQSGKTIDDLGEEAVQRLSRFGDQLDLAVALEGETAKPVPFGLVDPARTLGQVGSRPGLHGAGVQVGAHRAQPQPGFSTTLVQSFWFSLKFL